MNDKAFLTIFVPILGFCAGNVFGQQKKSFPAINQLKAKAMLLPATNGFRPLVPNLPTTWKRRPKRNRKFIQMERDLCSLSRNRAPFFAEAVIKIAFRVLSF
jgi:hypothetical protein